MFPRPGHFQLVNTPAGFEEAAGLLAQGSGPIAVDTERASGYRYDDRAFLVQVHRRGAGVFLFDPEGQRQDFRSILGPVLSGQCWVVHAAASDLPCLASLGLRPGTLVDTELGGRLLGMPKVNLAAMHEELLGIHLAKGHGAEDWSRRPLPPSWLDYAADDVAYLLDVAEVLVEKLDLDGKLDIFAQECAHILAQHAHPLQPPTFGQLKGVHRVRDPRQLGTARALFDARDNLARKNDLSPQRILKSKDLIEIALSERQRRHVFPRYVKPRYRAALQKALREPVVPGQETSLPPKNSDCPSKSSWPAVDPHSWDVLTAVRDQLSDLADSVRIPVENLIQPAILREAVWECAGPAGAWPVTVNRIRVILERAGARAWQIDAVAGIIFACLREAETAL
ncbi:HRDC domain-containing protein [Corynebacterium tapiri]|uniref:Ribonuclease D n=1 Tax=Corynebacterium tapiri TaxID=1448266 RepID=A0A5C4U6S7_9CORY|nr:HRDC domain-containing protein [Corynebacterium tapiri]TNL99191.1 ribonuclease D [Corynebacterium tapiri]